MTDIAIRVENLSKLYHIGRAQQRHDTLRDALGSVFSRQSRLATDNCELKTDNSLLWALKDVSFEVQQGEVVGTRRRRADPTSGRAETCAECIEASSPSRWPHTWCTTRRIMHPRPAVV
jgi:hypothetical protein